MSQRCPVDLLCTAGLAIAAAAILLSPIGVSASLKAVLALPLVFLLPGYAVTAAIHPGLDPLEAQGVAVILGVSLSTAVIAGLALNYTPWGLERKPWALSLAGITVAAAVVAVRRRRGPGARHRRRPIGVSSSSAILLGLSVLVVTTAIGIDRLGAIQNDQRARFTQLWLLPSKSGLRNPLLLGLRNDEGTAVAYSLIVKSSQRVLANWHRILLRPNKTWARTVTLPPGLPTNVPVVATLYHADQPKRQYRRVTFWPRSNG